MAHPPSWTPDDLHWDPEDHFEFAAKMPALAAQELARILAAPADEKRAFLLDPRCVHRKLHQAFVTAGQESLAGSYRGSDQDLLRAYEVAIDFRTADHRSLAVRVAAANQVAQQVAAYQAEITKFLNNPPAIRRNAIALCAAAALRFLQAHPFANGNGHVCRIILPTLASFTSWPFHQTWTASPSPFTPEFKAGLALASQLDEEGRKDGYRAVTKVVWCEPAHTHKSAARPR